MIQIFNTIPLIPISADNATFFTPSSYTASVIEAGPKTLSAVRKPMSTNILKMPR
jgi:hypothetical protein